VRDRPPDQRPIQQAFDALLNEFRVAINHDRASLARHPLRKLHLLIGGALLLSAVGLGAIGFILAREITMRIKAASERRSLAKRT
jgi:hypothetical protein